MNEPMRNVLALSSSLVLLVAGAACEGGPAPSPEPPVLKVTSPVRGLVQGQAGPLTVSGTVTPNADGDAIDKVLVNNVQATVESDGSFRAQLDIVPGATMIETIARDRKGTIASDTRTVHAGPLHAVGTTVTRAVTAAMSADTFAKLSAAAGPFVESLDMQALLAPLQPMVHFNDPNGEDCGFARLFVDNITFSDIRISLAPVQGGLAFSAEIDDLDVPGRARYAVLCVSGQSNVRVTAQRIAISGTLKVTPSGTAGFTTRIADPDVSTVGFRLSASGVPAEILALLGIEGALPAIVSTGAELAMGPLLNRAFGALGGPQKLDVLGKQLEMQVSPAAVSFSPAGAQVVMNMRAMLAGSESSPGFIYTDNGMPAMDPAHGFQVGLADDLANEMLAELKAIGMLDLTIPTPSPAFDETRIRMTVPPMISADAADGEMRLVLGDMIATYVNDGTPVAKAAINARVDLKIAPAGNGHLVALELGAPDIHVNTLDDIANVTGIGDEDLASATAASLTAQIAAISELLVAIPIPAVAGLHVRDLSIGSDEGYVMLSGSID